jgi:glutathione peroxidase
MVRSALAALFIAATVTSAVAGPKVGPGFSFASIDGGTIMLDQLLGHPVLVVNTASLCGFAPQFDDLQALHDKYSAQGLTVLAVPSDDFRQELDDAAAIKEFCATNFNLTLPMTDITHVTGKDAHPFYQWLADTHGFAPNWNFNKILIGAGGEILGTWGSTVKPGSRMIVAQIEAALN